MPYYDALFHGFEKRSNSLRSVKRWRLFDVMYYRTNLEQHSHMVAWVTTELLPIARKADPDYFTPERGKEAITLALVHDDHEPVSQYRDVSSLEKALMDQHQRNRFETEEERAIRRLAAENPKTVNGFVYADLLRAAREKNTPVSQLVSYADKVVGLCEALHEIYAGNGSFVEEAIDGIVNRPVERYIKDCFDPRREQFPLLTPLFRYNHPLLNRPTKIPLREEASKGSPHTKESIKQKTGHAIYDKWKEVIQERGGEEGLQLLIQRREFPNSRVKRSLNEKLPLLRAAN